MSLSLTLAFDKYRRDNYPIIASNRLAFDGDAERLRDALKPVVLPLPAGVEWYDDEGLKHYKTDPYGNALTCVSAGLLAPRLQDAAQGPWGHAVLIFVQSLPADTRVALWWG
jgi:hypothetical protein